MVYQRANRREINPKKEVKVRAEVDAGEDMLGGSLVSEREGRSLS